MSRALTITQTAVVTVDDGFDVRRLLKAHSPGLEAWVDQASDGDVWAEVLDRVNADDWPYDGLTIDYETTTVEEEEIR